MSVPFSRRQNNLLGQTSHGTHVRSSFIRSSSNFPTQNISGPLRPRLNSTELGFIRSDSSFPGNMHLSHYRSNQPQNTLNINIFLANNSSLNINFLNNISSSHRFSSSSTNAPDQNNVTGCPSSNFHQIFSPPNQQPLTNNGLQIIDSPQFTTTCSQNFSPRITTVRGLLLHTSSPSQNQESPVAIPFSRQNAVNSSFFRSQSIHCSDHSLLGLSSTRYFQSSTMNPPGNQSLNFEGINDKSTEDELHPHHSIQTPGNFPELEHSDTEAVFQVPYQNDNMTEPRRSQAQTSSPTPRLGRHLQARGRRPASMRCRSHPYIKYGPYTCPKCQVTFQSSQMYAAHVQKHYRDESPNERKIRREGKLRCKDLHIAQSTCQITVMPGSLPEESKLLVTSNTTGGTDTSPKQGEGCSRVKIKEEIETD